MVIPSNKLIVPNTYENGVLLSNMRKLYNKVYERFGNLPEELMLPDIEELRDKAKWNENSGWTFIRWNILFEERDVITTLNAFKEIAKPVSLLGTMNLLLGLNIEWVKPRPASPGIPPSSQREYADSVQTTFWLSRSSSTSHSAMSAGMPCLS